MKNQTRNRNWKLVGGGVLACLLCITLTAGAVLAFLTARDTVTNTFTMGDVDIEVLEPGYPGNDSDDVKNRVPGDEISKDPLVHNIGLNDAVVFMTVTLPLEDEKDVLNWRTDDGEYNSIDGKWHALDRIKYVDADGNVTDREHAVSVTYVYGYEDILDPDGRTESLFDFIQIANIKNPGGAVDMVIDGYAIQRSHVTDVVDGFDDDELERIWDIMAGEEGGNIGHKHEYVSEVTKDATCYEKGIMTYVCECGNSYTEEIPMTVHVLFDGVCTVCGHKHEYVSEVTKDATCYEKGILTYTCECGGYYEEKIPMTEHVLFDGVCTVCGHKHEYVSEVTKEATCREKGILTYTCECGGYYEEKIPMTEHDLADGVCSSCGVEPAAKSMIANWEYTLDDENNIVTLQHYIGDEADVYVYDSYTANDKVYLTQLGNTKNSTGLFDDCKNIKSIVFDSDIDTCNVTDMRFMFYDCNSLTTLDISGFDTSNVTKMSSMFYDCNSLTTLDISGFDTSKVTTMSSMFYDCNSLTTLDISGFDTSKVTIMSSMFYDCNSLTTLDISGFDTSKVTTMSSMFQGCSSLTSLDASGFDTSKVTTMSSMFHGCSSLTSLDASGFDTSKVTTIGSMFRGCSSLISLDVSGFNTSNVTSMFNMFRDCFSLTSLDVSGFDTSNVTNMAYMFASDEVPMSLTFLDVSGFNTSNVTNMDSMFYGCSSLTSLDVSDFDTGNVTNMMMTFRACSSLTSLDVSGFDTSNVTCMSGMFRDCSSLTSLDVSGFDTSNVTDVDAMFFGCKSLMSLDVSGFDTSNVTNMNYMFSACSSLTVIYVGDHWSTSQATTSMMFFNCKTNSVTHK